MSIDDIKKAINNAKENDIDFPTEKLSERMIKR